MIKRTFAVLLSVALFVLSICTVCAENNSFTIKELADCRRVYAYSGSSHAYFYGFSNTTLYSARVLPDTMTRYVTVNGVIRSVCHDETYASALYQQNDKRYKVMKMNMNSGDCIQYDVPYTEELLHKSFACADGEAVVIVTASPYAYAAGFSDGKKYRYSFSANTDSVFVNGNKLYTLTDTGEIYRLSKGGKTYCASISSGKKIVNAGNGYVCSEVGELVSLDGKENYRRDSISVKTANDLFAYPNGAQAVAVLKNDVAVLKSGGACEVNTEENDEAVAAENDSPNTPVSSGELSAGSIAVFEAGVTVSQLKNSYSNVTDVLDADGKTVSSGKLKTGFTAKLSGGSCRIAVLGDVNGSGDKNKADVESLMKHLVGSESLNECEKRAADLNKDSVTDNRDLPLLAQSVG